MSMPALPFVIAARDADDARDLLARFGGAAAERAATLADGARRVGNHLAFCRWRQIERLVRWLETERAPGTIH